MKQSIDTLKTFFETGDKPTQQQMYDFLESYHHLDNGMLFISKSTLPNGDIKVVLSDNSEIIIHAQFSLPDPANANIGDVFTVNSNNEGGWLPLQLSTKFIDGANALDAVYMSGNVGVGKQPTHKLDVDGSVYAQRYDIANNVNLGLGFLTLKDIGLIGVGNTAYGNQALRKLTTGGYNTAIGNIALTKMVTGNHNIAIGASSMSNGISGNRNIAMGFYSLNKTIGSDNIGLGTSTLQNNISGSGNIAFGLSALSNIASTHYNIAIGHQAGRLNVGENNVFLGRQAGYNELGSNKLYISNSSTTDPLIYGEFNNRYVKLNVDRFNLDNMQNTSIGLVSGDVWRDGNNLKIV